MATSLKRLLRSLRPTGLLVAASTLPVPALAVDWFVPDSEAAAALGEALEAGWPEPIVQVRIGESSGTGIWVEAGQLVFVDGETERRADAADLAVQVLLARSWTRDIAVEDMGWAPTEALETVKIPTGEAPDEGLWMSGAVGGGARFPDIGSVASAAAEIGWRWRALRVGSRVGLSALESLRARGDPVHARRPHALAVAWTRVPIGSWEAGFGLGSGLRLGELRSGGSSSWFWTLATEAGLRLISDGGALRPGVALTGSYDTAQRGWLHDGRPVAKRQIAAGVELVVIVDRQ